MKQIPWILSAAMFGLSGYLVANITHQSSVDAIDKSEPGKIRVEYSQENPVMGKWVSFFCAGGLAGSLFMALRQEKIEEGVRLTPLTAKREVKRSVVAYDEDPEIELEEADEVIETEESAGSVEVFAKMYDHIKRHLLIPCATGGGKTSLLFGAIEYGLNRFGSEGIEFFASSTKRGLFLGLGDEKADDGLPRLIIVDPDRPETVLKVADRLRWLRKRLVARGVTREKAEVESSAYNPKRNVICLDEWNETLAVAQEYDAMTNASKEKDDSRSDVLGELKRLVNSFVRTGREDEMVLWIFGQDHQVQNAGINTGYTKSLGVMIPFRASGSLESIEDAFQGRSPLVAKGIGTKLLEQANALVRKNPEGNFVYSSVFGHEFLEMPFLPDIKRKRLFGKESAKSNVVSGRFPKAVGAENMSVEEDFWGDE